MGRDDRRRHRRVARRGLAGLLGGVVALGPAAAARGDDARASAPVVETARADADGDQAVELRRLLAAQSVFDAEPARRVLYTWTSAEQIEALRAGEALLSREASPTHGRSAFDEEMEAHRDTIVGELLTQPGYTKRRFAWSAPWPTMMGAAGESYGDHLLRIELAPEAVIAIFDTTADPALQGFVRADGTPVTQAGFEADPGQLTAVYHVSSGQRSVQSTFGPQLYPARPVPWREFVVVSEVGVASWSYGTEALGERLAADRALLAQVHAWLEAHPEAADTGDGDDRAREARALWAGGSVDTVAGLYASAQALPAIDAMALELEALAALRERLEAVIAAQGDALELGSR